MATLPLTAHHSIAIIGAGISGLACGQVLANCGASVTLFDKARGPGGRMSSKRRPLATLDLGAQAFSVRDPVFQRAVDEWLAVGCLAPWPTRTYQASPNGWQAHNDGQMRFTGAPRMSALTRHLADSLTALPRVSLHADTSIVRLQRAHMGWQLVDAAGISFGPYDRVVISAPPPQAHKLVAAWDDNLAAACQTRKQRACWAGWAIFDGPIPAIPGVEPDWQMVRIAHHSPRQVLNIVSRNQTKPGREAQPESLSLLAHLDWSEAHLELSADEVAEQLVAALKRILPTSTALPNLIEIGAHRWRYAQPASSSEHAYLYSENGLALCGDSFRGGRVEDAWLSGHGLGEALIGRSV
ncbi:NAD(P)/FAD-dependent oxidoreductase [Vreelandella neptunia]|uniref:FAD-dependent oxidoreductase n=1 Tax=Vreelandella neptunia TaxID=115551 RepID=A0ABS9S832_9GAMM|nr:FAD-dependent oxidoreductase [Halomonas neptunia]MCH4812273.1 FAD-dependent oxidoreductase [Halomonas neptunia]